MDVLATRRASVARAQMCMVMYFVARNCSDKDVMLVMQLMRIVFRQVSLGFTDKGLKLQLNIKKLDPIHPQK